MNAGGSHRFEEALVSWKFTGPEGKSVGFVSPFVSPWPALLKQPVSQQPMLDVAQYYIVF